MPDGRYVWPWLNGMAIIKKDGIEGLKFVTRHFVAAHLGQKDVTLLHGRSQIRR